MEEVRLLLLLLGYQLFEPSSPLFGIRISDNLVGKGGYAEVYRGILQDGQAIAVKRLSKSSSNERKEKEFLTEIGTLGHVCHPNVSSLLGCCLDNGLYLIFQFSSRGSVASLLHGNRKGKLIFEYMWSHLFILAFF